MSTILKSSGSTQHYRSLNGPTLRFSVTETSMCVWVSFNPSLLWRHLLWRHSSSRWCSSSTALCGWRSPSSLSSLRRNGGCDFRWRRPARPDQDCRFKRSQLPEERWTLCHLHKGTPAILGRVEPPPTFNALRPTLTPPPPPSSSQANCIDSTAAPEAVFASEVKKMSAENMKPQEQLTLEPYERDHAVVVGIYRYVNTTWVRGSWPPRSGISSTWNHKTCYFVTALKFLV